MRARRVGAAACRSTARPVDVAASDSSWAILNVRGGGVHRPRPQRHLLAVAGVSVTVHFYAKDDDWDKYSDAAEIRRPLQAHRRGSVTIGARTHRLRSSSAGSTGPWLVTKAVTRRIVGGLAGLLGGRLG